MQFKIELKVRNHNTLPRQTVIDTVVSCVPSGWTVDLEDARVFILVEVFKVHEKKKSKKQASFADRLFRPEYLWHRIVKDYYAHQKFNVIEIANTKNSDTKLGEGRVATASHDP
jgi:tRNA acetyltransferase TAN1